MCIIRVGDRYALNRSNWIVSGKAVADHDLPGVGEEKYVRPLDGMLRTRRDWSAIDTKMFIF